MKLPIYLLSCFVIFLLFSSSIVAVNKVSIRWDKDLQNIENGISNEKIGQISIVNDNNSGFEISIESANDGKMILDGTTGNNPPESTPYTLTFVLSDRTWFFATNDNLTGIQPKNQPTKFAFDIPIGTKSGRTSGKIDLNLSCNSKSIWHGAFSDTLTVSIQNI